ncbi:MAG: hypothetical protein IT513_03415 [Burkholderiales bacterium]|nr:hypothetical protein [Burkholderiales bacterium]
MTNEALARKLLIALRRVDTTGRNTALLAACILGATALVAVVAALLALAAWSSGGRLDRGVEALLAAGVIAAAYVPLDARLLRWFAARGWL